MAVRGDSAHFTVAQDALTATARFVANVVRENYPDLAVPRHSRWRHFAVSGVDRWARIAAQNQHLPPHEIARARIDLAVVSVLLDAGAGGIWRYREAARGPGGSEYGAEGPVFARSEGLAVASIDLFQSGALSADPDQPLRADAAALAKFDTAALETAFQVDAGNPLAGLSGRAGLLRSLGEALTAAPELFGDAARAGNLFDHFIRIARDGEVAARDIFGALLTGLATIWPARLSIDGVNLGDVWRHPAIHADDATDGLVPFHKLAQWLCYSIVEILEDAGLTVTGLEELTGLPEYRNGGLLIDLGVIRPRTPDLLRDPLPPSSEAIVEWRALTVVLLDRLADPVRAELGVDARAMPLASLLEGGTWKAGRKIAERLRADGGPPIRIISDGTVM
jgi:uncharacterized protein DUF1688